MAGPSLRHFYFQAGLAGDVLVDLAFLASILHQQAGPARELMTRAI